MSDASQMKLLLSIKKQTEQQKASKWAELETTYKLFYSFLKYYVFFGGEDRGHGITFCAALYIIPKKHRNEMSALVWATESTVLGLWALVYSLYSNPFHAFIARSHVLISAFTLLLHLAAAARNLPIEHAISEAFVCVVSSLLLIYVTVLLDPSKYSVLFTMSTIEFIPLDGIIGLAWFTAVFVSALGMALCEKGRRSSLMFHHFGYHMLVVPPSFLILWLYDYDGSIKEPISTAIGLIQSSAHQVFFVVLSILWGLFVFLQAAGEGINQFEHGWSCADIWVYTFPSQLFKFLGRALPILISFSASVAAHTMSQAVLAWVLMGIAAANSLDFIDFGGWAYTRIAALFTPPPPPENPPDEVPRAMNTESFLRAPEIRWRDKMV